MEHYTDTVYKIEPSFITGNDKNNAKLTFMRPRQPERLERVMGGPVQTEVNEDPKSTNERGPSLVGSLGLSYR